MSEPSDNRKLGQYFFIFMLAALFAVQWSPAAKGCDKVGQMPDAEAAATVNGQEIPLREFQRVYNAQLEGMRRQGMPAEFAKQFGMDKQVLDSLVDRELMAQAAEAKGIRATDEDVAELLKKQPEFQVDGQFNLERYKEIVVNYEGTTEVAFEDKLRRQIASQRLLELVGAGAVVSDDEVKARYQKDGNTANVAYVRFNPTMFSEKVGNLKQADVDAWVKAHDKDISDYYEQNKISYFVPEKVKAKQIVIRVPKDATQAQKDDARQKLENVRKQIVDEKKDFGELAKAVSEDVGTKEKGGELGWVDKLSLPGDFADRLFALKPGEVTMVVESPLGFHIGTVEEKKAPEQKPLDSVKNVIAAQLAVREKAKEFAKAEAEKALAELKKGKKLSELYPADTKEPSENKFQFQAETKPEAKETGEFSSSAELIPQLGAAPDAMKAIFARTDAGPIDQVVQVGEGFAVLDVVERRPTSDADYAAKQVQLKADAIKAKRQELESAFRKSLKQSGNVVVNDKAVAKVTGEG
jgi:peptidyl-prolyl cis-trans isomerase D